MLPPLSEEKLLNVLNSETNKLLEHLGDAILHTVWIHLIMASYPKIKVAQLTTLRGFLNSNRYYADLGRRCGLEELFKYKFARDPRYRHDLSEKSMANIFEAYMGAVWEERMDMRFMMQLMDRICDWKTDIARYGPSSKIVLMETLQRRYKKTVKLRINYTEDRSALSTKYGCDGVSIYTTDEELLQAHNIKVECEFWKKKDVEAEVCRALISTTKCEK